MRPRLAGGLRFEAGRASALAHASPRLLQLNPGWPIAPTSDLCVDNLGQFVSGDFDRDHRPSSRGGWVGQVLGRADPSASDQFGE